MVVDMTSNRILDCQDYHAIGEIDALEIRKYLRNCFEADFREEGVETIDDPFLSEDDSITLLRFRRHMRLGGSRKLSTR